MFACFGSEGRSSSSRARGIAPKRSFRAFGLAGSGCPVGESVPMERREVSEEEFGRWLMTGGQARFDESVESSEQATEESETGMLAVERSRLWEPDVVAEPRTLIEIHSPDSEDMIRMSSSLFHFTELQLSLLPDWLTTRSECGRSCNICLEQYKVNSPVRTLPCFHFFHTECIDTWLLAGRNSCPVCKRKVSTGIQEHLI